MEVTAVAQSHLRGPAEASLCSAQEPGSVRKDASSLITALRGGRHHTGLVAGPLGFSPLLALCSQAGCSTSLTSVSSSAKWATHRASGEDQTQRRVAQHHPDTGDCVLVVSIIVRSPGGRPRRLLAGSFMTNFGSWEGPVLPKMEHVLPRPLWFSTLSSRPRIAETSPTFPTRTA